MEHVSAGKNGMPVTRDAGRVMRPGDEGFDPAVGAGIERKTRACVFCQKQFVPTSNAQKRCPACKAKVKSPTPLNNTASARAPASAPAGRPATKGKARAKVKGRKARMKGAGRRPTQLPAPALTQAPQAEPARSPSIHLDHLEIPFNAGVLVQLLRGAADRLEQLERGTG